jgi:hypothetical protein
MDVFNLLDMSLLVSGGVEVGVHYYWDIGATSICNSCEKNPYIDMVKVEKKIDCPVCFDSLECGDLSALLCCNHSFHLSCIQKWLYDKTTCPCCRTIILEK